jgi:hypothetical protein
MKRPAYSFQDNKTYLLESRLLPRLKACHCQTFESYLNFLRFDAYRDREVTELYTVITTNETYFFRDEAQLDSFMKVMIPEVMKTNAAQNRSASGAPPAPRAMSLIPLPCCCGTMLRSQAGPSTSWELISAKMF